PRDSSCTVKRMVYTPGGIGVVFHSPSGPFSTGLADSEMRIQLPGEAPAPYSILYPLNFSELARPMIETLAETLEPALGETISAGMSVLTLVPVALLTSVGARFVPREAA